MEIKAKCKFDLDSVKALTHLTLYRKGDPKKRVTFWCVNYSILFAIIILEIIAFGANTILLVLLGAGIAMLGFMHFWHFIIPKIQYKSYAKMGNAVNEYIFCDNVLKIFTRSQQCNAEGEIEYSLFVRVYETTKYLFLFNTNKQVLIVDKNTIEGGTAEDIRNKLSAYVKDKYIICKY